MDSKLEFGLGWLRAVAQGYNCSCNKNELGNNFQRNLICWRVKLRWGFDGCALCRKVTITGAAKLITNQFLKEFKYAILWGSSVKHQPMKVGKDHQLQDEDVIFKILFLG